MKRTRCFFCNRELEDENKNCTCVEATKYANKYQKLTNDVNAVNQVNTKDGMEKKE